MKTPRSPGTTNIKALLQQLTAIRRKLFRHRVRDYCDYAEILVAQALGGARHRSGIVRGHDVVVPGLNRIEVRSRTRPLTGKTETRVPLKAGSRGQFDWLAVSIFGSNGDIEAAYLLPHDAVWELADAARYSRIPVSRALAHPSVRNITDELRSAESDLALASPRRA